VTEMVSEVQFVTQLIQSTLPNTTFLPISGNHEWFPTDQVVCDVVFLQLLFCCSYVCLQFILPQAGTETRTEDLLNQYANLWSFLGVEQTATLRRGGFYSKSIEPGLRYIGLNSQ
jgi:hypothetical protein